MLRVPTNITSQIIKTEKYVCPPWLHPLSCMNDPRLMVPESVANNGDHAWEQLQKSKVWWFLLPLPLMFLWDYLKNRTEIILPHKRISKNPIIKKGRKISEYTTSADITKENVYIGKLPYNPEGFVSWEENTYQANLFETPEDVIEKNQKVFMPRNTTKGRILPFGMRPPFEVFYKSAPKALIAAAQYILGDGQAEIIFMSTRPGWKKQGLMSAIIDAIKEQHGLSKVTYWEPTKAGKAFAKKKNPAGRCTFGATVTYKRGYDTQTKNLMVDAFSMTDARNKFQTIIDKHLRNATLESLHVEKLVC